MPALIQMREAISDPLDRSPLLAAKLYLLFSKAHYNIACDIETAGSERFFNFKLPQTAEKILAAGRWNPRYLSEYFEEHGSRGLASLLVTALFIGQEEVAELAVRNNEFIFLGNFTKAFCPRGLSHITDPYMLTPYDLHHLPNVSDYQVAGWLGNRRWQALVIGISNSKEDYAEIAKTMKFVNEKYLTLLKIIIMPKEVLECLVASVVTYPVHRAFLVALLLKRQQLIKSAALQLHDFVYFTTLYMQERQSRLEMLATVGKRLQRIGGIPRPWTQESLAVTLADNLRRFGFYCVGRKSLLSKTANTIEQELNQQIQGADTASAANAIIELVNGTPYQSVSKKAQLKYAQLQYANAGIFATPPHKPPMETKAEKSLESIELMDVRSFRRNHFRA